MQLYIPSVYIQGIEMTTTYFSHENILTKWLNKGLGLFLLIENFFLLLVPLSWSLYYQVAMILSHLGHNYRSLETYQHLWPLKRKKVGTGTSGSWSHKIQISLVTLCWKQHHWCLKTRNLQSECLYFMVEWLSKAIYLFVTSTPALLTAPLKPNSAMQSWSKSLCNLSKWTNI